MVEDQISSNQQKQTALTSHSGATSLPAIGNSFMYLETSGNNCGDDNTFVCFEWTDIIQITNITF